MIIGTEITGGEVAAGAGTDMTDTMAGKEFITIEAGVIAIVQTMADPVVWAVMMMSVGAGVGLLKGHQFHLLIIRGGKIGGPTSYRSRSHRSVQTKSIIINLSTWITKFIIYKI